MKDDLNLLKVRYKKMNAQFGKEIIYPLTNRGFYSEMNNLILAVLYCLENKISLKIYSQKWSGGRWDYYFNDILLEYHGLIPVPATSIFNIGRIEKVYYMYHKNIMRREIVQEKMWDEMRKKSFTCKNFFFPELKIQGNIFHAKKQLLSLILDYNEYTLNEAFSFSKHIKQFASESFGIHVRRGDKKQETNSLEIEKYITKALSLNPKLKKIVICTDDYSVIEEFKILYPDFKYFSFCEKSKKGYSQKEHNSLIDSTLVKREIIDIIRDSYLLTLTKYFIGTYSSNISRYIVLKRNNIHCYSLDINWHPL